MLGIHEIQAPFAAQFGAPMQGSLVRGIANDINSATQSQADHARKMQELQFRAQIAQANKPPVKERSPDDLQSIIDRLGQQQGLGGLPFGGAA